VIAFCFYRTAHKRQGDAFETTATSECGRTDARYAIGYCKARQATATLERKNADARYAIGYCKARQATATREHTIADARNASWKIDVC